MQANCIEIWHLPEPTQYARDEGYLSQELELMQIEEHQPESAPTCSGSVGSDENALIERVEPSSSGAAE